MRLLLLLLTLKAIISSPAPPVWGGNPQFQVDINVTAANKQFQMFYQYDAVINSSRYNNVAPQYDGQIIFVQVQIQESCNSFCDAPSSYLTHNCTVSFTKDNWFYINFPQDQWCCKCAQIGIVEPGWLQTNSKYKGQLTINGQKCNWWTKQGFELNNYCSQVGTDLPVRYWESVNGTSAAVLQWDFILSTYKVMQFNESLFDAPVNCQKLCGGACAEFRNMTMQTE